MTRSRCPGSKTAKSPGPDNKIPIRVYSPLSADGQPILVFYHGGGFRLGGLDSYDPICRDLAARSGAIVVSVAYRLAPKHVYPAALDDSYAAVEWVHSHATDIGGDANASSPWEATAQGETWQQAYRLRHATWAGPPIVFQLLIYPVLNFAEMETESHKLFAEGYLIGGAAHEFTRDTYLPNPADRRRPVCLAVAGG